MMSQNLSVSFVPFFFPPSQSPSCPFDRGVGRGERRHHARNTRAHTVIRKYARRERRGGGGEGAAGVPGPRGPLASGFTAALGQKGREDEEKEALGSARREGGGGHRGCARMSQRQVVQLGKGLACPWGFLLTVFFWPCRPSASCFLLRGGPRRRRLGRGLCERESVATVDKTSCMS
ncbi:hypothetical protein L209DRAFT_136294 [Thermothelomyces heterothallicus CBS 203.75]